MVLFNNNRIIPSNPSSGEEIEVEQKINALKDIVQNTFEPSGQIKLLLISVFGNYA